MLKGIHAPEDRSAAENKAREIVARLKTMKLKSAAELVEQKVGETLNYYAYLSIHWRQIRTNNPLERIIREIRRRTRVVGAFPDGAFAMMLVAARLRHIASTRLGKRRYLVMATLLNTASRRSLLEDRIEATVSRKCKKNCTTGGMGLRVSTVTDSQTRRKS